MVQHVQTVRPISKIMPDIRKLPKTNPGGRLTELITYQFFPTPCAATGKLKEHRTQNPSEKSQKRWKEKQQHPGFPRGPPPWY